MEFSYHARSIYIGVMETPLGSFEHHSRTQVRRRSVQFISVAAAKKGETQFYAPSLGQGRTEGKHIVLSPR